MTSDDKTPFQVMHTYPWKVCSQLRNYFIITRPMNHCKQIFAIIHIHTNIYQPYQLTTQEDSNALQPLPSSIIRGQSWFTTIAILNLFIVTPLLSTCSYVHVPSLHTSFQIHLLNEMLIIPWITKMDIMLFLCQPKAPASSWIVSRSFIRGTVGLACLLWD